MAAIWNPITWLQAVDPAIKRVVESPIFRTYVMERGMDRLARAAAIQNLFRQNETLGRAPEAILMAVSEFWGTVGLAGLNGLWDDTVGELVRRSHDPRFKPSGTVLFDAITRATPDGYPVVLDLQYGGWHGKRCPRAPRPPRQDRHGRPVGPNADRYFESSYQEQKDDPGFRWEPCCDPNRILVTKSGPVDENSAAYDATARRVHKPGACPYATHLPVADVRALLDDGYEIPSCCVSFFTGVRISRAVGKRAEEMLTHLPETARRVKHRIGDMVRRGWQRVRGANIPERVEDAATTVGEAAIGAVHWTGQTAANTAHRVGDAVSDAGRSARNTITTPIRHAGAGIANSARAIRDAERRLATPRQVVGDDWGSRLKRAVQRVLNSPFLPF